MTENIHICNQPHELAVDFEVIARNEKRTLWVVVLTLAMMVFEIIAGYMTGSMALLADGYHMASHAGALGIAFGVYRLARSEAIGRRLNFGTGKLLPLGGYTSAVGLGIISIWMAIESFERLLHPIHVEFNEAIGVAVLGLVVNLASAALLGFHDHGTEGVHDSSHDDDHEHEHLHEEHTHDGQAHVHHHHSHSHVHDHNHKSALMHVLADALTSLLAIFALVIGKYYHAPWLDPLMGVVGAIVIIRWAYSLCRTTARELLDAYPRDLSLEEVRRKIEGDGHKVLDLHAWRSGPSNLVCILSVQVNSQPGEEDFRRYFQGVARGVHLIVEKK
jgi:cation diffusion facilitator family transporter